MGNDTYIPPPLHNFKPSGVVLQKEDAQDRMILLLKAQGLTNVRIAEELKCSVLKVQYTTKQPWFMQQLVTLLHEKGEKNIDKLLEIISKDAIQVAYAVMQNQEAGDRLRAECAFKFILAHRGQKVVVENVTPDLKSLQAEEEKLRSELAGLKDLRRESTLAEVERDAVPLEFTPDGHNSRC